MSGDGRAACDEHAERAHQMSADQTGNDTFRNVSDEHKQRRFRAHDAQRVGETCIAAAFGANVIAHQQLGHDERRVNAAQQVSHCDQNQNNYRCTHPVIPPCRRAHAQSCESAFP